MKCEKHVGEWETWHYLFLTDSESKRVFLSNNESVRGWKRNGGTWNRYSGDYNEIPKQHIDTWLRSVAGHKQGETWECDRYYYENEIPPELPKLGDRLNGWHDRFICYPDRDQTYYSYGWSCGKYLNTENPGMRSTIGFHEGRTIGHRAEDLPTIFALLFL